MARPPMNLVLFFSPGGRLAQSWRRPESHAEELYGLPWAVRIAKQAEAAKFDALFIADVFYYPAGEVGRDPFTTGHEPFTLMGAWSAATEQIGFIGTVSATFVPPFLLARYFASLDHLSGGRVGWNIVTSIAGGELFGIELPPKEERYARADEYLEVVKSLWDAWDDDAVVLDREAGVWARADRIHMTRFEGNYYRVTGQLKMPRSPQGWPVLVQAGQSPVGMDFAARNAEVVFTAQTDLARAREYYRHLKERAASYGRDPSKIKILPGISPIVAGTRAEADRIARDLAGLIDMDVGRESLALVLQGADLSGIDLDEPVPPERLTPPDRLTVDGRGSSRYANYYDKAVRGRMTLRELIFESEHGLGHSTARGTAAEVADQMEEWYSERACDGFAITPVYMPEGLDAVCDLLLPELRRRGLVRDEYEGTTLRERFGLERPPSPRARAAARIAG